MTVEYEPSPPSMPKTNFPKYKEKRIRCVQDVLDLVESLKDKGIPPADITLLAEGDECESIITAEWTEMVVATKEEYENAMKAYDKKMMLYVQAAKKYYKERLEQLETGQY